MNKKEKQLIEKSKHSDELREVREREEQQELKDFCSMFKTEVNSCRVE